MLAKIPKHHKKRSNDRDRLADAVSPHASQRGAQFGQDRALKLIEKADGRLAIAKRHSGIIRRIMWDLDPERGPDGLSELQRQLAMRLGTLCMWCELQDARAASGEQIDLQEYGRTAGYISRVASQLGLKRQAKDLSPSLEQYVAANYGSEESNLEDEDVRSHDEE